MKALGNADPSASLGAVTALPAPDREFFALIDRRRLERECFVRCVEMLHPQIQIIGYASAAEFAADSRLRARPRAILYNTGSLKLPNSAMISEIENLTRHDKSIPVIVLSQSDDLDQMIATHDAGATGFIPGNMGIEGIIEAAKLTASGGVFLSFEILEKFRECSKTHKEEAPEHHGLTGRQAAVAEALRRGKANKTIAYELNMCESTVKVHIRAIMRKLNATNRTEAAFKLNTMLPGGTSDTSPDSQPPG